MPWMSKKANSFPLFDFENHLDGFYRRSHLFTNNLAKKVNFCL